MKKEAFLDINIELSLFQVSDSEDLRSMCSISAADEHMDDFRAGGGEGNGQEERKEENLRKEKQQQEKEEEEQRSV